MANKFEGLPIFKEAHELVLMIYKYTKEFPQEEKFGLVSQLRRAGASIVANIIEGNSKLHKKEFLNFLFISKGSLEETKYHLLLSRDLGYIDHEKYQKLHKQTELIGKQLAGLIKYWRNKTES